MAQNWVKNALPLKSIEAAGLFSDEILDKFAFSGNPQDLMTQVEALFDTGVKRIEFGTPHGFTAVHGIKLIGEKVLPALQKKWG
ncbi:MAG: hypothetical protein P4L50_19165 [Anaerolineaceae bacterium]|nr:hypothetical protein [Anaerolineaceae bacterium]